MAAQTGIATGLNVPGVSSPTINLQIPNIGTQLYGPIPKVKSTDEALRYPANRGSEDVLLDENDSQIAYFRTTDQNGFVQVDRRRCVPEPELTQEEKADQRYLSRNEFANFIGDFNIFREEMIKNVRELTDSVKTLPATYSYPTAGHAAGSCTIPANAKPITRDKISNASFASESEQSANVSTIAKSESSNAAIGQ